MNQKPHTFHWLHWFKKQQEHLKKWAENWVSPTETALPTNQAEPPSQTNDSPSVPSKPSDPVAGLVKDVLALSTSTERPRDPNPKP